MKHTVLATLLGLASAGALAQEFVVPVLSSTPIVQQVTVPRQVCGQPVAVDPQTTGGGGLLGGLIGAGIGSQFGGGNGRAAGTVIGAVAGALIGNSVEAAQRQGQVQTPCTTQMVYENRTVGYNVTYEYVGRSYTVQMPNDPGPTLRLQLTPVGAAEPPVQAPHSALPVPVEQAQLSNGPVVVAPPQVVYNMAAAPVYAPTYAPVYAPVYRPYYPPLGISLNLGYSRGWHRH